MPFFFGFCLPLHLILYIANLNDFLDIDEVVVYHIMCICMTAFFLISSFCKYDALQGSA